MSWADRVEGCEMTDVIDPDCGAYVVGRLSGLWAANWCGCKKETHSVGCAQKEVSKHEFLLLAVGERGEMRSE